MQACSTNQFRLFSRRHEFDRRHHLRLCHRRKQDSSVTIARTAASKYPSSCSRHKMQQQVAVGPSAINKSEPADSGSLNHSGISFSNPFEDRGRARKATANTHESIRGKIVGGRSGNRFLPSRLSLQSSRAGAPQNAPSLMLALVVG